MIAHLFAIKALEFGVLLISLLKPFEGYNQE